MHLVREGSGVVNDVCTQVLGLYEMLGVKEQRLDRPQVWVSTLGRVCLCV